MVEHVYHIPLRPGHSFDVRFHMEPSMIAILTFCNIPLIKRLDHHHESHLITQTDKIRVGHIVSCSDCIATHILKQSQLMAKCRHIDCGAKRSEVMVVTYAVNLAGLAVKEESLLRDKFNRTDTKACIINIKHSITFGQSSSGNIQIRSFRRP